MTRLALDPPTLLQLVRRGEPPHPDHQLVAPASLRSRALGLLLDEVRSGTLTDREALRLHTALTEVKVRLLGDRVSRRTAWELAREHDWADLDDAEHLAVTRLQADALVAADPRLVARADGLVDLAPFEALFRP